jgi:hypothetical protein
VNDNEITLSAKLSMFSASNVALVNFLHHFSFSVELKWSYGMDNRVTKRQIENPLGLIDTIMQSQILRDSAEMGHQK